MSNNKKTEATRFAKENGFKSLKEMMDLLTINAAMVLIDEQGSWSNKERLIPALRDVATLSPTRMRIEKNRFIKAVSTALISHAR